MKAFLCKLSFTGLIVCTLSGCMYQTNTKAEQAWESDLQLQQQTIKRCQDANLLYANLADKAKAQSPIYQYAPGKACPTG